MYKLSCSYRCKWMWLEEKEKIQKREENKNYCVKIYQFIKLARSFLIEHFSWAGKSNFCWWFHVHWWLNLWSMSEDGCDFVFYLYHLISFSIHFPVSEVSLQHIFSDLIQLPSMWSLYSTLQVIKHLRTKI